MDLSTTYLGLKLKHPIILGASPLTHDVDKAKQVAEAGAAAIVMHSLFEEQILLEHSAQQAHVETHENANAEATSFVPKPSAYSIGPDEYLELLSKVKAAVDIPVIGSLNGVTNSGWLDFAKRIQQAGADALELNVYSLPTNPKESGSTLESRTIEMVRTVKHKVTIPVTVKLSPFYTSPASFVAQLEHVGANGFAVFNRFYQPDIDVEQLEVKHTLELSTPAELLLRLRWLAVISANSKASLALTGGVHSAMDVLKSVMAGAHAVQVVSAILTQGPGWIKKSVADLEQWLVKHEYESLRQALGSMNLSHCPEPAAYERANYMRVLSGFTRADLQW
jgi:dihydroorotate dehydrogenase (fumarate)